MLCAPLLVLSLVGAPYASADEVAAPWTVRMRRIEGAAVDARRAAEDLQVTAKKISDSVHLGDIPALKTQLEALDRWVISARMAVDVARQETDERN